jgi:hypothetical protein
LSLAAEWGYTDIVKMLLEKDGIEVNKAGGSRCTPLSIVTKLGAIASDVSRSFS